MFFFFLKTKLQNENMKKKQKRKWNERNVEKKRKIQNQNFVQKNKKTIKKLQNWKNKIICEKQRNNFFQKKKQHQK